jgi:biotin carboxylase
MTDSAGDPLLLVGFHGGVQAALRALGRPACALMPRGLERHASSSLEAVREVDLHGPLAALEEAAQAMLGGRRPAAVVALAERTVVVAAHLRELFALPGNSPATAMACADKVEMKRAMDRAGVPVAPWRVVEADTSAESLVEALGLPLVLKPRRDSGGRGQRRLDDLDQVASALAERVRTRAFDEGFGWLAEGWIEGVEMSIESFVQVGRPLFVNPTEYTVPRHANILPAPLPQDTWTELRAFNERALAAAGVDRGMTHLELFRTRHGPVFGELASRPPGGRLMPLLKRAWGFDAWEALLRVELGETPAFPERPRRTAGAWLLHPGPGRVVALHGVEEARALPHLRRVALKIEVGDTIAERLGSGQDVGAIYAEGPDRDCVARALHDAHDRIEVELA